jgi:hypothetical protein
VNGPEHYRQAEQLLRSTLPWVPPTPADVARAQVHATLALAAATALAPVRRPDGRYAPTGDYDDWCAATATTGDASARRRSGDPGE